jgi:16S rRNA (guanine966-N2)-methyltransferase
MASALAGGWIAPGAMIVLEERRDVVVTVPGELEQLDHRIWGDTQVSFFRAR